MLSGSIWFLLKLYGLGLEEFPEKFRPYENYANGDLRGKCVYMNVLAKNEKKLKMANNKRIIGIYYWKWRPGTYETYYT